jgi:transketolase
MQSFGPRRALWVDLSDDTSTPLAADELNAFEKIDAVYRALCAILFNYVPMSGHPGGSISSGRFVSSLLFDTMDYDIGDPDREDADVISYAAGHKALGLYSMWALRNELVRIGNPSLLPGVSDQLRFEDLLGFRRNPTNSTPLFGEFASKALDGHPTPATPFVRLSTGASGVGVASSLGHALGMADWFGDAAPRLHIVEGEGGLTPGRVAEALAFAGTASLNNVVLHLDWNQSSIDSDHVTREGDTPGDYVQWDPRELFYLHDWNVVYVPNGFDFQRIIAAHRRALSMKNGQPTAIVYRTTKGWQYGIQGRASHGAGHKLCSKGFYDAIPLGAELVRELPHCGSETLCNGGSNSAMVERCFWDALSAVRRVLEREPDVARLFANRIQKSKQRLDAAKRAPRANAPAVEDAFSLAGIATLPRELELAPGSETTLRGQLGKALGFLNKFSGGSIFVSAADLLGSTSISEGAKDFAPGFYSFTKNRDSRTLAVGGICEDAMSGILSGLGAFGKHIGSGASYGAFLAPLGHIAARLHAIGNQARFERNGSPGRPMILICGHAGLKTGEDGPTHADPQPLQLFQENFPPGAMITLTPWDPCEIWPLLATALSRRPSVIAPFVTRPNEKVLDREALRLAPATDAVTGVYLLRKARGDRDGTVVLQESGVTYAFLTDALPQLERAGIELDVYYVASAELFDLLPLRDRERILPPEAGHEAIGITGFTLPTMYRWIQSDLGRAMTMHPYMNGQYPGSGTGRAVIAEAGLDGESQYRRIVDYLGLRVATV